MDYWKNLTIRKKLTCSFIGLTVLLGLVSAFATGIMLRRAQSKAMLVKADSLANLLGEAVAPTILTDERDLSGTTERALNFIKSDKDVSLAGVVVVQNRKQVVEFQKKFTDDPKVDGFFMAGPLAATGASRYQRGGYQVLASPIKVKGAEAGKDYYLMLVMNQDSIDRELRFSYAADAPPGPGHGGARVRGRLPAQQRHRQAPGRHQAGHA